MGNSPDHVSLIGFVRADGTVLEEGHPANLFKEEKLQALKR